MTRLSIDTADGVDVITLSPAATGDGGQVRVNRLLPLAFVYLGATGTLAFRNDVGVGDDREDRLVYRGGIDDDTFVLATADGAITLNQRLVVSTDGVADLTLTGFGGSDTFVVNAPQPYTNVTLVGGDPTAGADRAILDATANTVVELGRSHGEHQWR